MAHEDLHDRGGYALDSLAAFGVEPLNEVLDQVRNIFTPLGKGWNRHADHGQTEIEIVAEKPAAHQFDQFLVGRRHDADVCETGRHAAQGVIFPFLKHAQQFDLGFGGDSPISSKNTVPPSASAIRPGLSCLASVKSPCM